MTREPVWRRYRTFSGANPSADLDDELRDHLDRRIQEYMGWGMSRSEAEVSARETLGDLDAVRRECEEIARKGERRKHRREWSLGLAQDGRFAARMLRRNPLFSGLAALTIAIGLAATTTIFAVVHAVVLRPLPFEDPGRVVTIEHFNRQTGLGGWAASFPQYLDYEAGNQVFESMAAWREQLPTLRAADGRPPYRVQAVGVTGSMFGLLGVPAALGRTFTPDDEDPANPRTAVLGDRFWRSYFGGDLEVVGSSLDLDGELFTVIGVLPASFRGSSVPPASTEIWLPYRNSSTAEGVDFRGLTNVNVIARLADDISMPAARADVERMISALASEHSEHAEEGARIVLAHSAVVGSAGNVLLLLLGAGALVLLIASTNVANLLLGRSADRAQEIAVRSSLGASRARLVRLVVIESVLIAALGGVLGLLLVWGGLAGVRFLDPGSIPRLEASAVNPVVIAMLVGLTLVVAILVGLVPALNATGPGLADAIKSAGRGNPTGRTRLRRVLVVAQVAVTTVLLVSAGLMLRSLSKTLAVDPGFDSSGVLAARITMPTPFVSPEWPQHVQFFKTLLERLEEAPGVESAAAAYQAPTDEGWSNGFTFAGWPAPSVGEGPSAIFRPVTPGYFETARIRLVQGRPLEAKDDEDAPGVVVVNERFVRRYLQDRDPIGVRLTYGDFWAARPPEYEIVGVVEDVLFYGPDQPTRPATYFAHAQQPVRELTLLLRASGDPTALLPALRAEVARLDPTLPLDGVTTLDAEMRDGLAGRRFLLTVFAAFAWIALLLAASGLYGVLSFLVVRRSHEIGVRMALGARRQSVLGLVMRQGMGLVLGGLAVGVVSAFALSRLLANLLFGVEPTDPLTFALAVGALALTGIAASLAPGLRATRLDPLQTLRVE